MIDQLITALSKEVGLLAEEIADTIWLALQMGQSESISSDFPLSQEDEVGINNRDSKETSSKLQPKTSDSQETAKNQPTEEQKAGIYPRTQHQTSTGSDLSFKVPDAPSLREPLTLARALKPLMRRLPSGTTLVLDEAATIQRIADEGLWLPVLRPTLESWLDLELVVDESISMQIWWHTIRDLERLLKNYGIFRDVRVWGLIADEQEQVQIRRGIGATAKNQPPRSPAELIDPSGRRLVLVVSDCVSSGWRNGKVMSALEIWSKRGTMAIVQMLPKWLWKRTALGRASEVRLQGLIPGVLNQKLIAKEVSLWDEMEEDRGIKVPVFTLEPDKVTTWAQMLAGRGSIWTLGYVFKLDPTPVNKESRLFSLDYEQLSAEQRVQAFRVTASPMARKLAGLLAAAPVITLPIVRLIRETLLKNSQQVHVAEVFLGGLLKPLSEISAETNSDYVQYDFMDGVRKLLVDSVPSEYVLNVLDEVSKYVAKKAGLSLDNFAAVLKKEKQVKDGNITKSIDCFATVSAQILRCLGREYASFADFIDNDIAVDNVITDVATINQVAQSLFAQEDTDKVELLSETGIDYTQLRDLLTECKWKEADQETARLMFKIAGREDDDDEELRFEDIEKFSYADLQIIDRLWVNASNGHFGFSVQKKIWQELGEEVNIETERKLGERLGWFNSNEWWLAYDDYSFSLDAPEGHLPASWDCEGIDGQEAASTCLLMSRFLNFVQVQLLSEKEIDYTRLRDLLAAGKWKEADEETAIVMLQASGQEERGWLDEEDIKKFPFTDLQTIDQLWVEYSNGKFGFSVQKRIWLSLGGQAGYYNDEIYKQFSEYVGWYIKDKDEWLNWSEHTFSLDAPQGHLPRHLPSQGKRIRPYLFSHGQILQTFEFETVIVNRQGEIIKTEAKQAQYFTENLANNISLEMVSILGGKFMMGSPEDEKYRCNDESPQHLVSIKPLFVSKYLITQAQWRVVANLPKVNRDINPDPSKFKGDNLPVERVSWYDAVEFCDRLSKFTSRQYRLPSEAEWEYACRAGTTTPFHFGDTLTGKLANYNANYTYADEPKGEYRGETTSVGSFPPNAFGLYDMHGNVREWCLDHWHDNYEHAPKDGTAWLDNNDNDERYHILRCGSWNYFPQYCRSASRINWKVDNFDDVIGFRIVYVSEIYNKYKEKNIAKLQDQIFFQKIDMFKSAIKEDIFDSLIDKIVSSPEIPDDNNEASITAVEEPYDITLEPEWPEKNENILFVVRFSLTVECQLSYFIYKADYYILDDKRYNRMSIDEWNEHYFSVEENYELNIEGIVSVEGDPALLESSILSDNELLQVLEDANISINSITNIEVV